MDPQACLERVWESFEARDFDACEAHLDDLFQWVAKDGALPVITGRREVDVFLLKLVFDHFSEWGNLGK